MEWSDDAINRIRMFWAEGLSTAEIGRRMGISKNAVVGKAHRLALQPRPSPIRREGQVARPPRRVSPRRISGPTLPSFANPPAAGPVFSGRAEPPTSASLASGSLAPAASAPAPHAPAPQAPAPLPSALAPALPPLPQPETVRSTPVEPVARPVESLPSPRVADARPAIRPVAVGRSSNRLVTCCWPIGEPGTREFRFCDAGALAGKPYCGEHAALAYVKVRDRREEAA